MRPPRGGEKLARLPVRDITGIVKDGEYDSYPKVSVITAALWWMLCGPSSR